MGEALRKPKVFGDYLLVERINAGGMAEVFKAKAFGVEGFERLVAVKRILPEAAEEQELINMFVDEARIAVRLNHPNIVQIHELGKHEDRYFIAMEYCSGQDLKQLLNQFGEGSEPMPLNAAAYIVSKICQGLDYAHRKTDDSGQSLNIIHRDIHPQNILLGYEGAVKLTDFGTAKAENRASKTQAGVLKGKFDYMSPEQVRGVELDHRSDIFSIGILLYEMVTGVSPFAGDSDFTILERVRNVDIKPARELRADLPEEFEAVLMKALAASPQERFATALELAEALEQFTIEDDKVFGARDLEKILASFFSEEKKQERERAQKYAALSAPNIKHRKKEKPSPEQWEGTNSELGESTQIYDPRAAKAEESKSGNPAESSSAVPVNVQDDSGWSARTILTLSAGLGFVIAAGVIIMTIVSGSIRLFPPPAFVEVHIQPTTAEVEIDGRSYTAESPIEVGDLNVGKHIIRARAEGYVPAERMIYVEGGEQQVSRLFMLPEPPVDLILNSNPERAEVTIGGRVVGTTPVKVTVPYPTAPIPVKLNLPCYRDYAIDVVFTESDLKARQKRVSAQLEALREGDGVLVVETKPADALVFIGEAPHQRQVVGRSPFRVQGLDPRVKYRVELRSKRDSKIRKQSLVDMLCVAERRVEMSLSAQSSSNVARAGSSGHGGDRCGAGRPTKLSVATPSEGGCVVSIGRSFKRTAPFYQQSAPSGLCTLSVSCESGRKYRTRRRFKEGGDEKIVIQPNQWTQP